MGTKRTAAQVHPSRRGQVPDGRDNKRHKTNHHSGSGAKKSFRPATTHPVNNLKAQARSLRRLLAREDDGLTADVRVEKERALQTIEHELAQNERAQRRNEMIGRYHKIRFFDRQKAIKRLRKAKKEYDACDASERERKTELRRRVADGEVNVNYALYYPLEKAYVSLYPRKPQGQDEGKDGGGGAGEEEEAEGERKGDQEMWLKVKQCMVDGTLDALRNGKLTERTEVRRADVTMLKPDKKRKKGLTTDHIQSDDPGHHTRRGERDEDADADDASDSKSDGGFFE